MGLNSNNREKFEEKIVTNTKYFSYICFRFTVRYGTISKFNTKHIL